jgi:hypothetical protein
MLHRMIPALPLLALAGCQPYYPYSQYSSYSGYTSPSYPYRTPQATNAVAGSTVPSRPPGVAGIAIVPAALIGGAFQQMDPHSGEVGFGSEDLVRKREVARYAGRYVERLTLKNGALFVYESMSAGDLAGPSDGELLKADLEAWGFRQRGITFDATKLGQIGPFTYIEQSSATDTCFIFRGKVSRPGGDLSERAYGNLCAMRPMGDPAAVRAEMLYVLSHVHFASENVAAAAAPAPAVPGATAAGAAAVVAPAATPATGAATAMSLGQCGYEVKFTSAPVLAQGASVSASSGGEYTYENGSYSEKAICSCRKDLDYSKVSDFDAVDNTRMRAEKRGFTLQKATFTENPDLGKELAYEASVSHDAADSFLVGRNFYRQCSLTVEATGTSYGDLVKAKKFIESVSAKPVEAAAPPTAISEAVIGTAHAAASTPVAAPRTPVAKSDLTAPAAEAALTPAAAAPATAAPATAAPATAAPATAAPATAAPATAAPATAAPATAASATAGPATAGPATAAPAAAGSATTAAAATTAPAAAAAAPAPAEPKVSAAAPATPAVASAAATSTAPATAAAKPAGPDTTTARLRRLKALLEQKLITPAEYEAKRKAILDSL